MSIFSLPLLKQPFGLCVFFVFKKSPERQKTKEERTHWFTFQMHIMAWAGPGPESGTRTQSMSPACVTGDPNTGVVVFPPAPRNNVSGKLDPESTSGNQTL